MGISEKIVSLRKAKGLTQQVLAEKTNLSLSTIKRIENGKANPRLHTLHVLSEILHSDLTTHHDTQNERKRVEFLMLFSMFLIFVPPLSIFFLWRNRSENNEIIDNMLSTQIRSFILFIFLVLLTPIISYTLTGQKMYGQLNIPLLLYLGLIIINMFKTYALYNRVKTNDT